MAKLIQLKGTSLIVQTPSGIKYYGWDNRLDSSTKNALATFCLDLVHHDLSGHTPNKYVSYEFLAMLKSPEKVEEEAKERRRQMMDHPELQAMESEAAEAKLRSIESQITQQQADIDSLKNH